MNEKTNTQKLDRQRTVEAKELLRSNNNTQPAPRRSLVEANIVIKMPKRYCFEYGKTPLCRLGIIQVIPWTACKFAWKQGA